MKPAWLFKEKGRYRDMMYDIKTEGKKSYFVSEDSWENWKQKWNTPKVQKVCDQNSKNRKSKATVDGSTPSTHSGGTATHYEHGKRLVIFYYYLFN